MRFGDFPAVESHAGGWGAQRPKTVRRRLLVRDGAAPRSCGGVSQSARLVRKNPPYQPHILFSSRRKENVPLTVQEKRAAGGAVPLWRTPPDPLLSAPQTDGFSPHKSFPRHLPAGPFCLVCWADRGPGASCPYGEGPRRALVTFPRWKVTRGRGGAAPQSCPQARQSLRYRSRFRAMRSCQSDLVMSTWRGLLPSKGPTMPRSSIWSTRRAARE